MELRPYQIQAVDNLRTAILSHKRVVLQSATGSGKSVIFTDLVEKVVEKKKKVLILTHREEIFRTTVEHLQRNGIIVEQINAANKKIDVFAQVFMGMVETLHKRNILLQIDLIIIDEAHFRNFNKIIDDYPSTRVIGVTATPIGSHFYKYYTHMVQTISINELIKQEFLTPCRAYQMQDDLSDLVKGSGDYTEESLYGHYNKKEKYIGVVDEWLKRCKSMKTIVFNVNIKHCEQMNDEFIAAGINSAVITSRTLPEDRKRILDEYTNGNIDVINSVGILTTGVDLPCTEAVVVNRATTSLALWLQMQGRASRTYPGKKEFIVLDFGRNHDEHGLWSEDRDWTIKAPKKKKPGVPSVKDCTGCGAMIHASCRKCEYCGAEMEVKEYKMVKGKMVEIVPMVKKYQYSNAWSLNGEQLYEAYCERTIGFHLAVRIAVKTNQIYTFAQVGGYTKGWAWKQTQIYNNK